MNTFELNIVGFILCFHTQLHIKCTHTIIIVEALHISNQHEHKSRKESHLIIGSYTSYLNLNILIKHTKDNTKMLDYTLSNHKYLTTEIIN